VHSTYRQFECPLKRLTEDMISETENGHTKCSNSVMAHGDDYVNDDTLDLHVM
jgi:hypothetical protein